MQNQYSGKYAVYKRGWRKPGTGYYVSVQQVKKELRYRGYRILQPDKITQDRNIGTLVSMDAIEKVHGDTVYRYQLVLGYNNTRGTPTDIEYRVWMYSQEKIQEPGTAGQPGRLDDRMEELIDLVPTNASSDLHERNREIAAEVPRDDVDARIGLWFGQATFKKWVDGSMPEDYPKEYEVQGDDYTKDLRKQNLVLLTAMEG